MLVAFKWLVGSWNPFVNFINIEKSEVYYIISISFEILQNLKLMMQDPILRKKNKTDFPVESPGAIWLHFFDHSISITHYSSLITHYSSLITHHLLLNFSHPFGIIIQFPSLNIFHTICGSIPVSRCSFFFFFQYPNSLKLIYKKNK